ncbi:MAG TPA: glycosyltransferase family 2 protein [Spirochaetota bacterium]|nr:glycosyltransferase family 2 protein [Spirochaetota bacterium]HQP48362.1 glycosyltransferase family 2 protein [Spirochaetota bacterium]
MKKKISIVIPVYNSEDCVAEVVSQINTALKTCPHEIIMVNDCSSDASWERISETGKKNKTLIGINLMRNFGQDNALMAGLNNVTGDLVVIMDDDLQHSPFDIPALVDGLGGRYDICYANFRTKLQAWWKNAGSWFNGKVAEILIKKPSGIYLSPFKIIRREVVDELVRYKGPYPYVDGLLLQVTKNVTQVDVAHHERFRGHSNYNFIRSLKVFMKLATTFSVSPLRFASLSGVCIAIVGLLLGIYYVAEYFFSTNVVEGWTSIVVINLVVGGMILMSLGVIGEYLGRAYLNINNLPQFVIREKTGAKADKRNR